MKQDLTANDYKMTRKTANRVIMEMSKAERDSSTFKAARVKFKSGTYRRYCVILENGVVIRSAKDWARYSNPKGFTSMMLGRLESLSS